MKFVRVSRKSFDGQFFFYISLRDLIKELALVASLGIDLRISIKILLKFVFIKYFSEGKHIVRIKSDPRLSPEAVKSCS